MNEVANGLVALDERPPVAIMPRGTGWDFVRTFGIPRDVEQAARVALAGNEREVDLGLVTYRAWAGDEAACRVRERRERRHERRHRRPRERDVEGARREGELPVGDVPRLRTPGRRPTSG